MPFGTWQENLLGGMTAAKVIIPATLIIFLVSFFKSTDKKIDFYLPWLAYAALFILALPSLLNSTTGDGIPHLALLLGYGLMMFLSVQAIRSTNDIMIILRSFVSGLAIVIAIVGLAFFRVFDFGIIFERPIFQEVFGLMRILGTEENPNAFANFFILGLPISIVIMLFEKNKFVKAIWALFIVIGFAFLTITVSRSAILGALIAICMLFYLKDKITVKSTIAFVIALIICTDFSIRTPEIIADKASFVWTQNTNSVSVLYNGKIYKNRELLLRDKELSTHNRKVFIPIAWKIIKDHPLTGVQYRDLTKELEPYKINQKAPHNIFLDIAIFFGIPALIASLIFFASVALLNCKSALTQQDAKARALAALCFSIMTGLFINGMFHSSHFNSCFWLIISISIASLNVCSDKRAFVTLSKQTLRAFTRKDTLE